MMQILVLKIFYLIQAYGYSIVTGIQTCEFIEQRQLSIVFTDLLFIDFNYLNLDNVTVDEQVDAKIAYDNYVSNKNFLAALYHVI